MRGNFATTYYDKKAKQEMDLLKYAIIKALRQLDDNLYETIIKHAKTSIKIDLELIFNIPVFKSYSKSKKIELLGNPHLQTPDLDNLIKNVLDRGNGILWKDDNSIYKITASKFWSDKGSIIIRLNY